MAQTRQEIRNEWNRVNLKHYNVSFHRTNDAEIVAYIEGRKERGEKTTDIFREAMDALIKGE